jgi:hypothetical protein
MSKVSDLSIQSERAVPLRATPDRPFIEGRSDAEALCVVIECLSR